MTLTWPWMLLAVPVIVAVAAWVLVRPGRRGVIVGSLSLWEQARDELRHAPRRRIRRVHLAWLLLLGGAIFAALAAAGPVSFAEKPSRRVAIELAPSAEFSSPAGRRAIRQAAEQLLGRLSPVDRAELLLPTVLGGRSDWLGPDQAAARIAELPSLPVRRGELSFPPPGEQAQHLYRFAPAGADLPAGPEASLVELPPSPPKITIDAFAAEPVDGDAELFVALRNHDDQPRTVSLQLQSFDPNQPDRPRRELTRMTAEPHQRATLQRQVPPAAAYLLTAGTNQAAPLGAAGLARRPARRVSVALTGQELGGLQRFVAADPLLEQVADAAEAELVLAHRTMPPSGKPAILFNPPQPPPGHRRGAARQDVRLAEADLAADDPLLRAVHLSGVGVRRVAPWTSVGNDAGSGVILLDGEPVVWRTPTPVGRGGCG